MIGGKSVERVASSGSEVVGHRRFITGSLAAGAALTTGAAAWKAWPQNAPPLPTPTVPMNASQQCRSRPQLPAGAGASYILVQ
jgi:hypothetical protein